MIIRVCRSHEKELRILFLIGIKKSCILNFHVSVGTCNCKKMRDNRKRCNTEEETHGRNSAAYERRARRKSTV